MSDWSAPVDRWVRRATDRNGKVLTASVRLFLDDAWSRADAPSKRLPGHQFIYGRWSTNEGFAETLACTVRNIEKMLSKAREAGLAFRGECVVDGRTIAGLWLANVPECGRFTPEQIDADANKSTGTTRTSRRVRTNDRSGTNEQVDGEQVDGETNDRSGGAEQVDGYDPNKSTGTSERSFGSYKEDPIKPDQIPKQVPDHDQHTRPRPEPSRTLVDASVIRAIRSVGNGGWDQQLQSPKWAEALGAVISGLHLTPDLVAQILEHWDTQFTALDYAERARVEQGRGHKGMPAKRFLWTDRPWLADAIAVVTGAAKPGANSPAPGTGHPVKLLDGGWGARVGGIPCVGDTIRLTSRKGTTWSAVVTEVLNSDATTSTVRVADPGRRPYGTTASLPGTDAYWKRVVAEHEREYGQITFEDTRTPEERLAEEQEIDELERTVMGRDW